MKYAIRFMIIFFMLLLSQIMTEKQILSLIMVPVLYIVWYCMDKEE